MTYLDWVDRFSRLTKTARADLRREIDALPIRPLISIILPVYNGSLRFLDEAVTSVRKQIYQHWEICLVDDASTDPRMKPFLEDLAGGDPRIQLLLRESNGHISACSNSALALARGEWCALLDQDDALAENALAEVVCEISRYPDASIIYSDEDFLDASGARTNPFFKPDWNPELFLAQNYLNHLGVYRTSLLREIGGFREGFEGSQDYDLALRCVARSRSEQIRHIPRLLYHWRMAEGSLAEQPDAKPYARHAARRALNSYLADCGIKAEAVACPHNPESHRVVYEQASPLPQVSIVSEARGEAFAKTDYPSWEIINAAAGAAEANVAAGRARGEVLVFLHREVETTEPGWLSELVSHVVRPEVGAAGGRLWSGAGKLEDGALVLGLGGIAAPPFRGLPREHPGYFNRAWLQQNFSAVSAACLAVRRDLFEELGGFDTENLPYHFYEIDFCLRLRERNLQVVWTPYANLILSGTGTQPGSDSSAEATFLRNRWGHELLHDPSYNPNLSLDLPGFVLAIPPRDDRDTAL
ncbi:MAG: glycosyltransferase [Spartobacteria bacterium]